MPIVEARALEVLGLPSSTAYLQLFTLRKLLNFPEPPFPHMEIGEISGSSPSLTGWQGGNNTNQVREKQFSKETYDADLIGISRSPWTMQGALA